jgi:hypothetical protein
MRSVALALVSATTLCSFSTAHADLPPTMQQLVNLGPVALAQKYKTLPEPTEAQIPNGFALAEHVVPVYDPKVAPNGVPPAPALQSLASLPPMMQFAAFKLFKGKQFDAKKRMLKDQLKVFFLPGSQAALSIGKIDDALTAAFNTDAQPDIGDGKKAMITNYSTVKQPFGAGDAAGWIDELRMVKPGLWLGRSFYKGKFWCYIVVYFTGR